MDLTLYLLSLPLWLSGLLVIGVPTLAATFGLVFVRRYFGLEWLETNNEVAGFKFAVVGVIYAVLLGFAVIVVWEKFRDAESAVTQEAAAVTALYRLSSGLDPEARRKVHDKLTDYAHAVIAEDWPAMAHRKAARHARDALTDLYTAVLTIDPTRPQGVAIVQQMLSELQAVTQGRRQRLALASGIVPGVVWLVLLAGAAVTLTFTFFFGTRNLRAQMLMGGMLALLIFMALFVVVSIDRPFTGPVRVTPEALQLVLEEFGDAH